MKKSAPAPTRRSTRAGKPEQTSKVNLDDSRTKSVKAAKPPATKGHLKKTGKLEMLIFLRKLFHRK